MCVCAGLSLLLNTRCRNSINFLHFKHSQIQHTSYISTHLYRCIFDSLNSAQRFCRIIEVIKWIFAKKRFVCPLCQSKSGVEWLFHSSIDNFLFAFVGLSLGWFGFHFVWVAANVHGRDGERLGSDFDDKILAGGVATTAADGRTHCCTQSSKGKFNCQTVKLGLNKEQEIWAVRRVVQFYSCVLLCVQVFALLFFVYNSSGTTSPALGMTCVPLFEGCLGMIWEI